MNVPTYTVIIAADKAGSRLDRSLTDSFADTSRSRLRTLILAGHVTDATGQPAIDPDRRVKAGETFLVTVPPLAPPLPRPMAIRLAIVYEDDHLIVVDKPAGMVVHPGAGNLDGTLVSALLAHCPGGLAPAGGTIRPGIVHRLDKDTTGLLVIAKTDLAYLSLREQFTRHGVERAYYACVLGNPQPLAGRIEGLIGRDPADRKRMAKVAAGGKLAVTNYRTLKVYGRNASLLDCRLETGRTHQIRVHMAAAGHPLIGDQTYRPRRLGWVEDSRFRPSVASFRRQALHAYLLGFKHPFTGHDVRFKAPVPNDFIMLLDNLESVSNLTIPTNPVAFD